ncbi:protein NLP2 isoform X2 [Phoenix dactylifera]|uniref:Protein NLP2 isoform X2 n=1 Tax=Phoenix dactylifera TaxID=42345 RepID=A0A8B8Z877_PHODC|nr:protein NLP2 isoform X2 [Phoenix dactylifera]
MDGFSPFLEGNRSPMLEDRFSYPTWMAIDSFTELWSPSIAGQVLSPFNYSVSWLKPGSETLLSSPNSQAPSGDSVPGICDDSRNSAGVDYCFKDDSAPQNSGLQAGFLLNSLQMDVSRRNGLPFNVSDADEGTSVVPKSMMGVSLSERLLMALSLFKESSGAGILAQVWMPVNQGDEYILSTYEQPYLLDQTLAGYREVSRAYTFSAKEAPGSITGLPGRVFVSGMPEWTSNAVHYHRQEYLRVDHARHYDVRGILAVPIFDLNEHSCCGVLELVTVKEKSDFDSEMDSIFQALQSLKMGQKSAFTEILDVLRAICHAHMLPLALTWIPLSNNDEGMDECTRDAAEANSISGRKIMLCIQESACYVNDQQMQGFLHACSEHHLQNGQGIAGKAIQSTHAIFSPDVKSCDVHQYPLAHHARKFGLHAAVAIRLRSTHTGNDDYILEFFLPIHCKGSAEQQLLLNNMSTTLQRICRSLRTVSDTKVVRTDVTKEGPGTRQTIPISAEHSQSLRYDAELNLTELSSKFQNMETGKQGDARRGQTKPGSPRHPKKKRSTVEKNISLSVLQQYYSETLKKAAKRIGVCPTTLKKICRRNGILRWPSRDIRKLSHSMRTFQSMIDSVPGVAGILKYDNATGKHFTVVSSPEKQAAIASEPSRRGLPDQFVGNLEEETCLVGRNQINNSGQPQLHHHEANIACVPPFGIGDKCKVTSSGGPSSLAKEKCCHDASSKGGFSSESLKCSIRSKSSCPMAALEEMHTEMDASERIIERSRPSYSSMTDSSSGSASSRPSIKRSLKNNMLAADFGSAIHVKATYKEETVRFKFSLSMGFHELIEVIGKRFKLHSGTFRLRYWDDEEEWVILANESDLQECVEVLQYMESQRLRLLVQDFPCATGSSASSNSLLMRP